jgi:hypothetical protein
MNSRQQILVIFATVAGAGVVGMLALLIRRLSQDRRPKNLRVFVYPDPAFNVPSGFKSNRLAFHI